MNKSHFSYDILGFRGVFMFKKAMFESMLFIVAMLVLHILGIPIELLTHRPIFNSLVTSFVEAPNRPALLGVILITAIACWFLLALVIWFFLSLNRQLAKHHYRK